MINRAGSNMFWLVRRKVNIFTAAKAPKIFFGQQVRKILKHFEVIEKSALKMLWKSKFRHWKNILFGKFKPFSMIFTKSGGTPPWKLIYDTYVSHWEWVRFLLPNLVAETTFLIKNSIIKTFPSPLNYHFALHVWANLSENWEVFQNSRCLSRQQKVAEHHKNIEKGGRAPQARPIPPFHFLIWVCLFQFCTKKFHDHSFDVLCNIDIK